MAGNFSGRGPESTAGLHYIGPFRHIRAWQGNVKEWVWNEVDGQRITSSGGRGASRCTWPPGRCARPGEDRTDTNGFRCIKESAPFSAATYADVKSPFKSGFRRRKAGRRRDLRHFRAILLYRAPPLDARIESCKSPTSGGANGSCSLPCTAASASWRTSRSRRMRPPRIEP